MNINELKSKVEQITSLLESDPSTDISSHADTITAVIKAVDEGKIRVAENVDGEWVTNAWIKNAILYYFKVTKMEQYEVGPFVYHDKIPLKSNYAELGASSSTSNGTLWYIYGAWRGLNAIM